MKKNQIITKSPEETRNVAKKIVREWIESDTNKNLRLVICLSGNLGDGKTTFVKGLAEELGIKETITSPTFLIMKKYAPSRRSSLQRDYNGTKTERFTEPKATRCCVAFGSVNLYHFDCYRISNPKEILDLGWKEIISKKNSVIAIEWPEKIKQILPKKRVNIKFEFVDEKTRRIIV